MAAERLSLTANPIVPRGADIATTAGKARFNPVLWLANRAQDLPPWLTFDSTRVSVVTIGLPDFETRVAAAPLLGSLFPGYEAGTADEQRKVRRYDGAPDRRTAAGRACRHRAARRSAGHRLSRRRRRGSELQDGHRRESVEEALSARAHRHRAGLHRAARARTAAGGDQDHRHPDALGDGTHRRADAFERQSARAASCSSPARPAWARRSSRRR